jgi:hypothetical protein
LEVSLCVVGITAAAGSLYWLRAAVQEIEYIKNLYNETIIRFGISDSPELKIFRTVVGQPHRHKLGLIGALFLPVIFIIIWVIMLLIFVIKPWAIANFFEKLSLPPT